MRTITNIKGGLLDKAFNLKTIRGQRMPIADQHWDDESILDIGYGVCPLARRCR